MFALEYTGQFRKDLKRMSKRNVDLSKLTEVLAILEAEGQVPENYHPHILSGNWKNFWECHIGPDWLLIYNIQDNVKLVRLVRTGTHSDLF